MFHYAAKEGKVERIKQILECMNHTQVQIAVNKQSCSGWTPLMIASQKSHFDIAKVSDTDLTHA